MPIEEVIKSYFPIYSEYSVVPIKNGNINKTFILYLTINKNKKKYLLQQLNKMVFNDPIAVIENSSLVLDYIKDDALYYLKTLDGKKYYIDSSGSFWRIFNFVSNSISFDESEDLTILYQTGKAYGNFFSRLSQFDGRNLKTTIPNFHNTKMRYKSLDNAVKSSLGRYEKCQREYALLKQLENHVCFLDCLIEEGKLPVRITHNDTKCNNVLFNRETHEYITVIDLDTVMPGYILHDFGDGARSICATEKEDSKRFENISFNLDKFYHYAKGFTEEIKNYLIEIEKLTLYMGILKITTELSVRFLTDFLLNDIYFKTDYPNHNLDRAINQLTLAFDVFDKQEEIKDITYSLLK